MKASCGKSFDTLRQLSAHRLHCKECKAMAESKAEPPKPQISFNPEKPRPNYIHQIAKRNEQVKEERPLEPEKQVPPPPKGKRSFQGKGGQMGIILAFFLGTYLTTYALGLTQDLLVMAVIYAGVGLMLIEMLWLNKPGNKKDKKNKGEGSKDEPVNASPIPNEAETAPPSPTSIIEAVTPEPASEPSKEEKKRGKKERKRKDKFFSEVHPRAYEIARKTLPRLHVFILAGIFIFFSYLELLKSNWDYILDWWNASWAGPAFIETISSKAAFQFWFQHYGMQFIVFTIFIVLILFTFYSTIWKVAFKDYSKGKGGRRRKEGRCYWRTNNWLCERWDRRYGSPKRMVSSYWLKMNWWPLFNFINPVASLVKLDTTLEEGCEVYMRSIVVDEKRIRRKVDNDPKHLVTIDKLFDNGPIPNEYADGYFLDRSERLVKDTTDLSFGNPNTRNTIMRSGLRLMSPKLRGYMLDARNKQQQPDSDKPNR
jgi:hypothetical protein